MKNLTLLLIALTIFIKCDCYRVGDGCHNKYYFENLSNIPVFFAIKVVSGNTSTEECNLSPINSEPIKPNEQKELSWNGCIEEELFTSGTFDVWVVDTSKLNAIGHYYDCSLIEEKNKVLKVFKYTVQDLRDNNWIFLYR